MTRAVNDDTRAMINLTLILASPGIVVLVGVLLIYLDTLR